MLWILVPRAWRARVSMLVLFGGFCCGVVGMCVCVCVEGKSMWVCWRVYFMSLDRCVYLVRISSKVRMDEEFAFHSVKQPFNP